jgi:hypothetical protein
MITKDFQTLIKHMTSAALFPLGVYFPGRFLLRVSVSPTARVSYLRSLIRDSTSSFVYNGVLLNDAMTFSFYRIRELETIVVVPIPTEIEKWAQLTQDADAFQERIQFILNEETARETARIRDLMLTKLERRPRPFRRLCASLDSWPSRSPSPTDGNPLQIHYPRADGPSCDPLPAAWMSLPVSRRAVHVAGPAELIQEGEAVGRPRRPNTPQSNSDVNGFHESELFDPLPENFFCGF